jgi:ribosomal protein S18 acetylase RimI-like enzyme
MDTAEPVGAVISGMNDTRLLNAMEANAASSLSELAEGMGGESYRGSDRTRYISDLPVPMLNGVISARLPSVGLDSAIDATLAPIQARSLPMIWWVGPGSAPAELGARLEAHGLRRGDETPCMAVDLSAIAPANPVPSVSFAQVASEAATEQFALTAAVGFEFGAEAAPIFQKLAAGVCLPPDPRWAYHLAYLDGQPVATCVTLLDAGVAGLYTICALPEARGRGIGGEITRHAPLQARARGYRVAVLQSSPMGFPVYRRLGFETIATFHEFEWTPQPQA